MTGIDTQVPIEDGKYAFIVTTEGSVICHRYGVPWVSFEKGSKAIIALIHAYLDSITTE